MFSKFTTTKTDVDYVRKFYLIILANVWFVWKAGVMGQFLQEKKMDLDGWVVKAI